MGSSKKKKELLLEVNYKDFHSWDRYKVTDRTKAKKRKITLNWIGGDGCVPHGLDGRFDGYVIDDGNGYTFRLDVDEDIRLDYSQAHAMLMLLQLVDNEPKTIRRFVLEAEDEKK